MTNLEKLESWAFWFSIVITPILGAILQNVFYIIFPIQLLVFFLYIFLSTYNCNKEIEYWNNRIDKLKFKMLSGYTSSDHIISPLKDSAYLLHQDGRIERIEILNGVVYDYTMTRKVGACKHPKVIDWWGCPLFLNEHYPNKINVFKTVEIALAFQYMNTIRHRPLYSVYILEGAKHVEVDAVVIGNKVYKNRTYHGSIQYYLDTCCDSDKIGVIEDSSYVTTFNPDKYVRVGNNLVRKGNNAV